MPLICACAHLMSRLSRSVLAYRRGWACVPVRPRMCWCTLLCVCFLHARSCLQSLRACVLCLLSCAHLIGVAFADGNVLSLYKFSIVMQTAGGQLLFSVLSCAEAVVVCVAIDLDGLSTFYHMPPCVSPCKRLATVFVCAGSMLALAKRFASPCTCKRLPWSR